MSNSSSLQTFKLWFESDRDIVRFKRLNWKLVEVSVEDVMLHGIHPWQGEDRCLSLPDAVINRIDGDTAKVSDLEEFNLCWNVTVPKNYYSPYRYVNRESGKFGHTLEMLQKDLVFVDSLTYLQLLSIAKERLAAMWSHAVASVLLTNAFPVFHDQRQFLKRKDKSIKLAGRGDIDRYDLGSILSLEDFADRDALLISEGIPTQNFRLTSWLDSITDKEGRLRLIPEISHLSVSAHIPNDDPLKTTTYVSWRVERKGRQLRFRPELGDSVKKREAARRFAKRWRVDRGRLCFTTTIKKLDQMLRDRSVECSFPTLNYAKEKQEGGSASVQVQPSHVQAFYVGAFPTEGLNAETLKEILRDYNVPMTGNKGVLIKKLANLAAKEYKNHQPQMDRFFRTHRLIKVRQVPANAVKLDVLGESVPDLQTLLVTMYILNHLRGEAIVDASHENNSYTSEELAHALIMRRVSLKGSFIPVQ